MAARRVGQFLRLAGGVHKAADVVEATLKAGSSHLRTFSLEQPWHKVWQVDIYAVYFAVVCLMTVFLLVLWALIITVWRKCTESLSKADIAKKKV